MDRTRIVIIDDQPLFCVGLRVALERHGYLIVGESTVSGDLETLCTTTTPNIAIVGDLVSNDALVLARLIRCVLPEISLIFLTNNADEEYFFQAIKVGATAYAPRSIKEENFLEMVQKVSQGEYLLAYEIFAQIHRASRVLPSFQTTPLKQEADSPQVPISFTSREIEVLQAVAQGKSNKEIATLLKIGERTVKDHLTSVFKKLSAFDRTAAVVYALKCGWIDLEKEEIASDVI